MVQLFNQVTNYLDLKNSDSVFFPESEEVHAKNLHLLNSKGINEVSTNLVTRNSDMKTGEINIGNKNKSETFNSK
jgi:hypothetical protein